ncbi:MAG: hypothetical protein QM679_09550 [Patulibacter sp.]
MSYRRNVAVLGVSAAGLAVLLGASHREHTPAAAAATTKAIAAVNATPSPGEPRTANVSHGRGGAVFSTGTGHRKIEVRAASIDHGASRQRLPAASPTQHVIDTVYRHGEVSESYRETALGVEQRVTIRQRPSGAGSRLVVRLAVGGASAKRASAGRLLVSAEHGEGLRYGQIVARDADRRILPSQARPVAGGIALRVADEGARYPVTIDPLIQDGSTLLPDGDADLSGPWDSAISEDGSTAVVGSPTTGQLRGTAWVFRRVGGLWTQVAQLDPSDPTGETPQFGTSVAISADGSTIAVGAPANLGAYAPHRSEPGAAWVFAAAGGGWVQQGPAIVPDDGAGGAVGTSVELSRDGATLALGGHGAWVFHRAGGSWQQQGERYSPVAGERGEFMTVQVAISGDGDTMLLGAPENEDDQGSAWAYSRRDGAWQQQGGELKIPRASQYSGFGRHLALSGDGSVAMIAGGNAAWFAGRSGSAWQVSPTPLRPTELGWGSDSKGPFGGEMSLSADGKTALIAGGMPAARGAWVFSRQGSGWRQDTGRIPGLANGMVLSSVGLASDGRQALVDGRTVPVAAYRSLKG